MKINIKNHKTMKKYLLLTLFLLVAAATQAQGHQEGDTLKLTIHYLFKADSTLAAPVYSVDTMVKDEPYCVASPIIEGHHADKDTVQGRMPDKDLVDTVFYAKDSFKIGLTADPEDGGTVDGGGVFEFGREITVTATPNDGYSFVNWTKGEVEVSHLAEYTFEVKEACDLVAHFEIQLPTIDGDIETPATICAGNALELTAPTVTLAEEQGWQLSPDKYFNTVVAYTGQELDITYNGWRLRYYAANAVGTVYSNIVSIKVTEIVLTLTGDIAVCSNQTGAYQVSGAGNADLTWTVSDANATVTESGKTIKVLWTTAGEQTVRVDVENEETGCTATAKITVNVLAYVNGDDLNEIVAKKRDGVTYLLIYPNPKEGYKYQWYKDGAAINGANGQYYYPANGLEEGVYKVYVSYNIDADGNLFGGSFTSECIVTGAAALFSVSPNPALHTDDLTVTYTLGGEAAISVYAVDGRLLHRQTMNSTQTQLNVKLPQGIYIIHLNDGTNDELIQKIIIQ